MNAATDLAVIPKESALEVFRADNGLDPYLEKIRAELDAFVPDVTTKKGRDAIASLAYKVAQSKTALDNVGKELVAELKAIPAKIDAERRRMRDLLDAWRDEVRSPLSAWEAAEADRVRRLSDGVNRLTELGLNLALLDSESLQARIDELTGTELGSCWEECEVRAALAHETSLSALVDALQARKQHEKELAELAAYKAEKAQRDAEEQARREAEQKAQAERDEAARIEAEAKAQAERRELELKLAAERAEREKLEARLREEQAQKRAAAQAEAAEQAERQRKAREQEAADLEAKAREANKAHRRKVNRAALEAFMAGGLSEAIAKQAVELIATGQVPAISIHY